MESANQEADLQPTTTQQPEATKEQIIVPPTTTTTDEPSTTITDDATAATQQQKQEEEVRELTEEEEKEAMRERGKWDGYLPPEKRRPIDEFFDLKVLETDCTRIEVINTDSTVRRITY